MKIIGFTGTKDGLTDKQKESLMIVLAAEVLLENKEIEAHHGDCFGGDATFDAICEALEVKKIVIHPGYNSQKKYPTRAFCGKNRENTVILEGKGYLVRDEDIAKVSNFLIACPKEKQEQIRSGTWTTVRRARKYKKDIVMIYPDGTIDDGRKDL